RRALPLLRGLVPPLRPGHMSERLSVEVHARDRPKTCPFCHDGLKEEDAVWTCPSCDAVHHTECATSHGRCSVHACPGKPPQERAPVAYFDPRAALKTMRDDS